MNAPSATSSSLPTSKKVIAATAIGAGMGATGSAIASSNIGSATDSVSKTISATDGVSVPPATLPTKKEAIVSESVNSPSSLAKENNVVNANTPLPTKKEVVKADSVKTSDEQQVYLPTTKKTVQAETVKEVPKQNTAQSAHSYTSSVSKPSSTSYSYNKPYSYQRYETSHYDPYKNYHGHKAKKSSGFDLELDDLLLLYLTWKVSDMGDQLDEAKKAIEQANTMGNMVQAASVPSNATMSDVKKELENVDPRFMELLEITMKAL